MNETNDVSRSNKDLAKDRAVRLASKTVIMARKEIKRTERTTVNLAKKSIRSVSKTIHKRQAGYTAKRNLQCRSRLLGKNTKSAIYKQREKNGLRNITAKAERKNSPQDMIKEVAKSKVINKEVENRLSDKVALIGKSAIQKIITVMEMIVVSSVKTAVKTIFCILSLAAPFIITICVLMLLLISAIGGYTSAGANINGSYSSNSTENEETFHPGAVDDVRTSLTYAEVHSIPWYSSASPFSGDIGLDKLSGDRGGNCTAYAWGRRCELEGKRTQLGTYGNACTWYDREVAAGIYKCGQTAKAGAVCCWSYNAEGGNPGHVAVIEKINTDGSIIVSNSAYGSGTGRPVLFYLTTYGSETELKSAFYKFNGYIYMEKVGESEGTDSPEVKESITGGVN